MEQLAYLEENGQLHERKNDDNCAPIDIAIIRRQGDAILSLMQMGYRARSVNSIERFLNAEPSDTPIKREIRGLLIEPSNNQ